MPLHEMLHAAATGTVHVEDGWGQGRATYGGLVAGMLVAAAREPVADAPLRSVSVSFVAPVAPGDADVETTVLRAGSRATQVQSVLRQEGQAAAVALASHGAPRESALVVPLRDSLPQLPAPESVEAMPHVPGMTPDFFAHVDLRVTEGGWPFSGSATADLSGWMRFREAPPTFGEAEMTALVDAWPPTVLQMLTEPRPSSTLTWTLELIEDLTAMAPAPDTWWAYQVTTDHSADGYARTHAHVWHPDGTLVAISRQTVAVFG